MENLEELDENILLSIDGGINIWLKDGLGDEIRELGEIISSWFE